LYGAASSIDICLLKAACTACVSTIIAARIPKRTIQSLDFSVNRVLMKLFRSSNIEIIAECRNHFGVELPSVQLAKRFKKFSDMICNIIA